MTLSAPERAPEEPRARRTLSRPKRAVQEERTPAERTPAPRRDPSAKVATRNRRLAPRPEPIRVSDEITPELPSSEGQPTRVSVGRVARALGAILLLLAVAMAARALWLHVRSSPTFALQAVAVRGNERLAHDVILRAGNITLGRNIFAFDPERVATQLRAHPWVADAHVRRVLPSSLQIVIREWKPAAILDLGDLYLVSDEATVIKKWSSSDPSDFPVLTGIPAARFFSDRTFRTAILLEMVALIREYASSRLDSEARLSEVHFEGDGVAVYIGEPPLYVRLGPPPFRAKLARLRDVMFEFARRGTRAAYVYLDNTQRPNRVTVGLISALNRPQ